MSCIGTPRSQGKSAPESYSSLWPTRRDIKKIGEEAIEVILAAASQGRDRIIEESSRPRLPSPRSFGRPGIAWNDILSRTHDAAGEASPSTLITFAALFRPDVTSLPKWARVILLLNTEIKS